jgi:hypothetical protein
VPPPHLSQADDLRGAHDDLMWREHAEARRAKRVVAVLGDVGPRLVDLHEPRRDAQPTEPGSEVLAQPAIGRGHVVWDARVRQTHGHRVAQHSLV